jgi:hypothetical protein
VKSRVFKPHCANTVAKRGTRKSSQTISKFVRYDFEGCDFEECVMLLRRRFTSQHHAAVLAAAAVVTCAVTWTSSPGLAHPSAPAETQADAETKETQTNAAMDALTDQLIAGTFAKKSTPQALSDSPPLSDQNIADAAQQRTDGTSSADPSVADASSPDAAATVASAPTVAVPSAVSPYGPDIMLRPIARNSFTIRLQKGAVQGAAGNNRSFMLRTAGYVIAHDVCGKFQMSLSSVAFRNTRDGEAEGVTGTVVCKRAKAKAVSS